MKCSICSKKIETTFLNKLIGTYMKNDKGKRKPVCNECQKKHTTTELKEKL
ncbi:MAG: hypothetical protein KKF46_07180 [Nanoarchaeota archaeon]|nr:hypothetical protein [Nanoarchaeota archaeon]MBU1322111.1 hypothetical protein [Nanoarchaeota archaeon]MBU1597432.1 hypothetical protein [Nanoarchaeota archaeon]MBU2441601.1 hypothetical protein [Nanoarchaeota archaeon]